MATVEFTSSSSVSPLSPNTATAQAAANWRAKVARRTARRANRATSPQHKLAVARNREMTGTRADTLEVSAAAGSLVAAHLLGGAK